MPDRKKSKDLKSLVHQVGQAVRDARKARGWTQAQLGERADLTDKFISRVESSGENLTLASLLALAKALGVQPANLLTTGAESSNELVDKCKAVVDAAEDNEQALTLMLDLLKVAYKRA